mgnify:CR=1 FL=1|jgi:cupin fold WbuC family metalloprotein
MHKIYSKVDPTKLLHLVNKGRITESRTDLAPDTEFLQCAFLSLSAGKTFKPHKHIWKTSPRSLVIAQESWVVIQGSVKCFFYDIDDTLLETHNISKGECSMTFEGGHTYEILEDDTVVYEYKTGPYQGQASDKVFLP